MLAIVIFRMRLVMARRGIPTPLGAPNAGDAGIPGLRAHDLGAYLQWERSLSRYFLDLFSHPIY